MVKVVCGFDNCTMMTLKMRVFCHVFCRSFSKSYFLLVHLFKEKLHLTCYDCETSSRCFAYCKGALANRSEIGEGILNNANLCKY